MWSDLRAAVPQGSSALQSLASSLPDVALASRAPVLPPSIFLLTTDGSLGHENMASQFFSLLRFTLLFICVI